MHISFPLLIVYIHIRYRVHSGFVLPLGLGTPVLVSRDLDRKAKVSYCVMVR
jgi:hypothetical protein